MTDIAPFLLVEDSPDDVLLVKRAFLRANILNPLRVVRDGDEAIEYLGGTGAFAGRERYPLPLVVLLDLKMPRRDGFEVLEWIRKQPWLANLRVIVLTSSESVYEVDRAYKLGARSFLVKPVLFERLVEMMSAVRGYWIWHDKAPDLTRPAVPEQISKQDQPAGLEPLTSA